MDREQTGKGQPDKAQPYKGELDKRQLSKNLLETLAKNIGLELSTEQLGLFERYAAELLDWNRRINLTAIEEPQQIIIKHFYDSLLAMKVKAWQGRGSLLDLGTGAGFPGLPLLILNPDLQVTLVDSLQKRIFFLEHLRGILQLNGIKTVHARAEELGQNPQYREKHDIVTSRAVAGLSVLLEYCLPLARVGGVFLAYKGPEAEAELKSAKRALEILGGKILEVGEFFLPQENGRRMIIVIRKIKNTPPQYPRRPGLPAKKPLLLS